MAGNQLAVPMYDDEGRAIPGLMRPSPEQDRLAYPFYSDEGVFTPLDGAPPRQSDLSLPGAADTGVVVGHPIVRFPGDDFNRNTALRDLGVDWVETWVLSVGGQCDGTHFTVTVPVGFTGERGNGFGWVANTTGGRFVQHMPFFTPGWIEVEANIDFDLGPQAVGIGVREPNCVYTFVANVMYTTGVKSFVLTWSNYPYLAPAFHRLSASCDGLTTNTDTFELVLVSKGKLRIRFQDGQTDSTLERGWGGADVAAQQINAIAGNPKSWDAFEIGEVIRDNLFLPPNPFPTGGHVKMDNLETTTTP